MIKIAVTGNFGSGKTIVCKLFSVLGYPVFNADYEAKKILFSYESKPLLKQQFGKSVFNENNLIDTISLANIVFKNPEKLILLNEIIHPRLFDNFNNWVDVRKQFKFCIMESAIIFEHGYQILFDKTILVKSSVEMQKQRVLKRDNISLEEFQNRLNNQLSEEEKEKLADFVILNDESKSLIVQVLEVLNTLLDTEINTA